MALRQLLRSFRRWCRTARRVVRGDHKLNLGIDLIWADTDELMLAAMFTVFERFYEREFPAWLDWHAEPRDLELAREVQALHTWWTETRPNRDDRRNETPCPPMQWIEGTRSTEPTSECIAARNLWELAHRDGIALTLVWAAEDTSMMTRLIAIKDRLCI